MSTPRSGLLEDVGRVLREDDEALVLLLERLAAGAATADERAELERRAAESTEVRLLVDACAPERSQRSVARAVAAVEGPRPNASGHVVPLRRPPGPRTSGRVRTWGRRAWGATLAVAAAAAVAIALLWPKPPSLPPYGMELSAHSRELRDGGPEAPRAGVVRATPEDLIEVVLRPEHASVVPVAGAVWVIAGGPPIYVTRLAPRGNDGVLAARIAASALPAPAAGRDSVLLVAVAAPGAVWSDAAGHERAAAAATSEPWIRVSREVRVSPP